MGVVYLGIDTHTGQAVAIKQLKREIVQKQPDIVERFAREAEALRALNHPNIVKALATVDQDGEHYIVMEYVPGSDLGALIRDEAPMPVQRVMKIAIELADALTRAHYLKIVHRDLKPANVLLAADGAPRLTDFGVAFVASKERVTTVGIALGTPDYMPPEALDGKPADQRGDIWALGIMLFEMLTGKHPFEAETLPSMVVNVFTKPVPDLEALRPDCPVPLADLIYRMLDKDANTRIPSVRLIGAELEAIMRGQSPDRFSASLQRDDERRFETPTPVSSAVKHNLSAQTTPFVGRENEIAQLEDLLDDPAVRLITVLGPGGMGKTRLAIELGHGVVAQASFTTANRRVDSRGRFQFFSGVFFVSLAQTRQPEAVINALADSVGFQFYPGGEPKQQLIDFFREKSLLLVVDNCEHVLEGLSVLSDILHSAPRVKIIATSRAKLNLQGEALFTIDGMDFPDLQSVSDAMQYSAVKLFVQSARRAQPNFELTEDDLPHVARICALVNGLPLGIELAAAWVEMLSLQEIADEVAQNLDFLETESHDAPDRHRSVRAVFDHSWNLLTPDERATFTRIAVFRGRFTRQAGQTVTGAGLRQLMALVNKSLLKRDPDSGVYQVHEVLRQYAEQKLTQSGEDAAIRAAHSDFYLELLAQFRKDFQSARQLDALREVEADIENIRAALMWACHNDRPRPLLNAVHTLGIYFDMRAQYTEGLAILEPAAAALRQTPRSNDRDVALSYLALWCAIMSAYYRQRERAATALVEAFELLDERSAPTDVLALRDFARGYFDLLLDDPVEARSRFASAYERYLSLASVWDASHCLLNWGSAFYYRTDNHTTDFDHGHEKVQQALTLVESTGDSYMRAHILTSLGQLAAAQRHYDTAKQLYQRAQDLHRQIGNLFGLGASLMNLTIWGIILGRYEQSRPYILENLSIQRERGNALGIAWALLVLSRLELGAGEFSGARAHAAEALNMAEKADIIEYVNAALFAVGRAAWTLGEYKAARSAYLRAYERADELNRHGDMVLALNGAALAALSMDDPRDAEESVFIATQLAPAMDDLNLTAVAQVMSARLALAKDDPASAWVALNHALAYLQDDDRQQHSYGWDEGHRQEELMRALLVSADAGLALGDTDAARSAIREAAQRAQRLNNLPHLLKAIGATARWMQAMGQAERAAELAARVEDNPQAYAYDRARAKRVLAALGNALPKDVWVAATTRGRALTLEQAAQRVLAEMVEAKG
jgi:non-specific serine/threonine protein kinase